MNLLQNIRTQFYRFKNDARFRDSRIYKTWLQIRNPRYAAARRQEEAFYAELFRVAPPKRIFDLGASIGSKAEIFRHYGSVVCVEPSSDVVALLKMRFTHCPEVTVLEAAIADREGMGSFFEFGPGSAYNTLSPKWAMSLGDASQNRFGFALACPHPRLVRLVTIDQLCQTYGDPDYIKIDVEGFELPAVRGMSRPCPLISTEFNLPEFAEELAQVVAHLEQLGESPLFNVAITEPPTQFEFAEWQSGTRVLEHIRTAGWQYVELFCRTRMD